MPKSNNPNIHKLKKYEILLVINKYTININTNIHILVILSNNLFLSLITLKIQNNRKIEYIDMLNKGNWGYNGNDKVKKYINDNKDKIYFVDVNYYYENTQIMKDVIRYVIKNGKKIDSVSSYDIYVFE